MDYRTASDWLSLIATDPKPHPITQVMPNLLEMAQMVGQSGYSMADRVKQASEGRMYGPGEGGAVTEDMLNLSVMGAPTAFAANRTAGPFYSALKGAVENAPISKGTGEQWAGTIRNMPGVKQEELDWTGFNEFLKSKPSLTKQEASDFLDANRVDVQEVMKQDTPELPLKAGTKFSQWQMPGGGENYRELLLTLPETRKARYAAYESRLAEIQKKYGKGPGDGFGRYASQQEIDELHRLADQAESKQDFTSGHYDEPNVLAHVRFNDRVDASGKKTLFLEEIQSDWHQKGRKEGYQGVTPQDPNGPYKIPVPDAPFKTSWPELSLKRMIKYAVDNGYDSVSWTPGKVQAKRYDLSTQVSSINWEQRAALNGDRLIEIAPRDGSKHISLQVNPDGKVSSTYQATARQFEGKTLDEIVGKDMAEKILSEKKGRLAGDDLTVGGEGMNAFYDKILVDKANALAKKGKWGTKVGVTKIGGKDSGTGMFGVYRGEQEIIAPEYATAADARAVARQRGMAGSEGYTVREGTGAKHEEVWSLPITDAMRKEVGEKGVPLFAGGNYLGPLLGNDE
jgi:hypothetical protein